MFLSDSEQSRVFAETEDQVSREQRRGAVADSSGVIPPLRSGGAALFPGPESSVPRLGRFANQPIGVSLAHVIVAPSQTCPNGGRNDPIATAFFAVPES